MSRGQWAEDWILHRCQRLEAQGRAFIRRVTPPAKVVSSPGGGRYAYLQAPGLPDFVGFLPGGRGVLFDVKSTREKSWAWTEGKNLRTKARQLRDLVEVGKTYHVVAGLLIGFLPSAADYPVWAWIPWQLLLRVEVGSWTPEALAAIGATVWQERPAEDDQTLLSVMIQGCDVGHLA